MNLKECFYMTESKTRAECEAEATEKVINQPYEMAILNPEPITKMKNKARYIWPVMFQDMHNV